MDILNPRDRLTKLYGIRSGRVTEFCKAMGWEVQPYQKLLMLRMMNRSRYKPFIPMRRPPSFDQMWEQWHHKKKDDKWQMIIIEEAAFLPDNNEQIWNSQP